MNRRSLYVLCWTLAACSILPLVGPVFAAGSISEQYPCYQNAGKTGKNDTIIKGIGIEQKRMGVNDRLKTLMACLGKTAGEQGRVILIAVETERTPKARYESPLHKKIYSLYYKEAAGLVKTLSASNSANIVIVTGDRNNLATAISKKAAERGVRTKDIVIFASSDTLGLGEYDIYRSCADNKAFIAAVELTELSIYYEQRLFVPIWGLHIRELFLISMELALGFVPDRDAEKKTATIISHDKLNNKVILAPDIK